MIKIQYASDLHLEFAENDKYIKHHPLDVVGDVLVLAGDMGYIGDEGYTHNAFWDWAADHFERTIVIPGNHEFYKWFDLGQLHNDWRLPIRSNVCCYYNSVIALAPGVDLIATTLWSHIEPGNAFFIERAVSDFRRIRFGKATLTWERFNEEHRRCLAFLKESIERSVAGHFIVVSHHVPSFQLLSPEFEGSALNGAFTVELGDYIAQSPIEYWIYGHSHRNIDVSIGQTRVVSNQLGYVFQHEHVSFDTAKHFILP